MSTQLSVVSFQQNQEKEGKIQILSRRLLLADR